MISWESGTLDLVAQSSHAAELQAATDAQRELTHTRLSLWDIFGRTDPLKSWQDDAARVGATLSLDSREHVVVGTRRICKLRPDRRWTHSAAQLADCTTEGSDEAERSFELLKHGRDDGDWSMALPSPQLGNVQALEHIDTGGC